MLIQTDQQQNDTAAAASGEAGAEQLESTAEAAEAVDASLADTLQETTEAVTANWEAWTLAIGIVGLAVIAGLTVHLVLFAVLTRAAKKTKWNIDGLIIGRLRKPSRLLFPVLAVQLTFPLLIETTGSDIAFIRHTISILLIAAGTWMLLALVEAGEDFVASRHDVAARDNLEARRIHTQLRVVRRTLAIFIVVIGAAAILMTFPGVRQFGASLLASAGLAGLVLGLAARPAVENIIAGLQIALTQPIRLDDVVIMEGEWGRVEEITTTYVVVKIWDERRLIVPFSKVISSPFQNWTRTSADILGTIFLYCDYSVDVDKVRAELERLVKGEGGGEGDGRGGPHEKWDGRVCGLVVTDCKERTLELRALISAATSGDAWDLRCHVREKLVAFLQREYPDSLPKIRAELHEDGRRGGGSGNGQVSRSGAGGGGRTLQSTARDEHGDEGDDRT